MATPKKLTNKDLRKLSRERFLRSRRAEAKYQRELISVGRQVGALVKGYAPKGIVKDLPGLSSALYKYSELLKPWARAVTENMHADVENRDARSWAELAREMGKTLRQEIKHAPIGTTMRAALDYQVSLISSIPLDAAKRVHKLTLEALITSSRASEIEKEILASGHVSVGKAKLIARTETSRTASLLMEVRAKYVGSTHYRWHTSEDSDVRLEHRKLNGKVFAWNNPPVAGTNGMKYNPGCGPNCRCFAEPLLPDADTKLRRVA